MHVLSNDACGHTLAHMSVANKCAYALQDGPVHAPIIRELVNYAAECKIIKECELDPKHNYVFAWHPHGRMFYGFGMLVGLFSSWFPEITNRCACGTSRVES
jgi:hypothetical protein